MDPKIACPNCKKNLEELIICDNDCGTICCDCGCEFYITKDKKYVKGHKPDCGNE